ncbi:AAA ATPase central domain protein [Thermovibrio ammonificans HB-1]|uniref:AAA ATPase central domain protein n=1 Tax=Thermovibrio ammonificans (strain DSM 15698 / JCM 12110 / HB-1) TaxID=648996 RepID=E8T412_THEA1|nr:AAA family ATPase [Thermovibrio ammonificans]ADU96222.1 AAA ATPase central domain protein [Thermovibrio ammonificans HB-1]
MRRWCDEEEAVKELKWGLWKVKLWVRGITKKSVEELEKALEEKFRVFQSKTVTEGAERTEGLLVLSGESESLGFISFRWECTITGDGSIPVLVLLEKRKEAREVEKIVREKLKPFLIPGRGVKLSFYNPYGSSPEYAVSPEALKEGIDPELFYGIEPEALARAFFSSRESLLILSGKPGTGKSKLIQFLLSEAPKTLKREVEVLVLKGNEALEEAGRDLQTFLYYDVVVLDDLETLTLKRGANEEITNLISTILSATDSFIPKRAKVIISTNRPLKEIDPALLRPGRLFDLLELPEVERGFIEKLAEKRPEFKRATVLFEKIDRVPIAKVVEYIKGERRRNYLKDPSISKRESPSLRSVGF